MQIKFFDFSPEISEIESQIFDAIKRVISSGRYILGKEVTAFEKEFSKACSCKHAIGVASGTDALFLALKAFDVGPGDEVITVANTFAATALAIMYTGATPVFIDIEPQSHLINPHLIQEAITPKTKAYFPCTSMVHVLIWMKLCKLPLVTIYMCWKMPAKPMVHYTKRARPEE